MNDETQLSYILDIRPPEGDHKRITVNKRITLGSSKEVDLSMNDVGLSPTHCSFKLQNEVLSIHNLGKETFIGKKELHSGKMYILDKGDKLTIGELEVLIRQDEIEEEEEEEEDDLHAMIEKTQSKTQIVRPGIVSKLLNKGPQIKQKVVVPEYNYPLFLVRFYSFLFTLSVSYGVYYFLIPTLELNSLVTELMSIINPLIAKAFGLLTPHLSAQWIEHLQFINSTSLILITLIYFTQNIIFSLIFGQTLPFTLLSISSDQSFVFKRISGLIRNIIALITTPLIIFDLMAIIGKRTTNEFLTRTHPVYHSKTFKLISLVLIFPMVILIGIFSPTLKDPTIFEESLFIPGLK
ncbi:MAG: FHA domain-containing protein, partial [Bdellovibrionales bacterium]|nr:FHA domain-containing protein [Bdellovibrionales bacterium]